MTLDLTNYKNLKKLVGYPTKYSHECTELQALLDRLGAAEYERDRLREATKDMMESRNCKCQYLNGVLIKWCGDHYL